MKSAATRSKSAPPELTARSDRQKNLFSSRQRCRQPVSIVYVASTAKRRRMSARPGNRQLFKRHPSCPKRNCSVLINDPELRETQRCSSADEGKIRLRIVCREPVGTAVSTDSERTAEKTAAVQHTVMSSPSLTGQHMLKKRFVDRSVREPSARNHAKREKMRKRRDVRRTSATFLTGAPELVTSRRITECPEKWVTAIHNL